MTLGLSSVTKKQTAACVTLKSIIAIAEVELWHFRSRKRADCPSVGEASKRGCPPRLMVNSLSPAASQRKHWYVNCVPDVPVNLQSCYVIHVGAALGRRCLLWSLNLEYLHFLAPILSGRWGAGECRAYAGGGGCGPRA